jgi:hypothetical protein
MEILILVLHIVSAVIADEIEIRQRRPEKNKEA